MLVNALITLCRSHARIDTQLFDMCTHARHARYVDANVDEVSYHLPFLPLIEKVRNFDNLAFHSPIHTTRKGTNMILEKLSVPSAFQDPSYEFEDKATKCTKRKDYFRLIIIWGNEGRECYT